MFEGAWNDPTRRNEGSRPLRRTERMNIIPFGDSACERTRRYLDSYINNELLAETHNDVLRHLETCSTCSAEFEARSRLKLRLKPAAASPTVPPALQSRIPPSL